MKTILLFITVILIHTLSYGQSKNDEYKKLIDSAIVIQTMHPDKVSYMSDIYLIDEKNQPYILASNANRGKFAYINLYDKKSKKLLEKGIKAWKVLSILNGNTITVSIIDFNITCKKNTYKFANGGGGTVIFEYSCDKKKWVLRETKWSGI